MTAPAVDAPTIQSGAEILARLQPKLREVTTEICLRPDLIEAWETANEQLFELRVKDEEKSTPKGRLANPEAKSVDYSEATQEAAKRVEELEAEIEGASVTFRFRGMPKDRWQALCDNHPPRKGNEFDGFAGYNRDAVVDEAVRRCLIDPVFDDEAWEKFIEVCNPSEWAELRRAANEANGRVSGSPKSVLASQVLAKRASTSASPDPGA